MKHESNRVAEFVKCFCEYQDIISFIKDEVINDDLDMQQIRCLWTAFCIRYDRMVDTETYDSEFNGIYDALMEKKDAVPEILNDKEEFYNFMCEFMC